MAKNNNEDTAVLEKPKEGEKSLEEKEPTAEELERTFGDEKISDARSLEQGASRITEETDTLAGDKEVDPALAESLARNAKKAEEIPEKFKDRVKEIDDPKGTETRENIEQYVLDPKESGASLEREGIGPYQKTLKKMYEWTPSAEEQEELKNFNAEPLSEEETQFHLSIIKARMRKTVAKEDIIRDQLAHLEDVAKRAREAATAKNNTKPEGQKLNVRALELAALYHDCSKHTENQQNDPTKSDGDLFGHSFHSAIDVGKILRKMGNIPEGVVKHIEQMILTHSSGEFPEDLAKKIGKARELGQGKEPGDFYLIEPKDPSAKLLQSVDCANGADFEKSYPKYLPEHFTNKRIFDSNVALARQTREKYFDIVFASFLKSTKDNIDGMKDEAVRKTSGDKELARSKFLADDFLNREGIKPLVDKLRERVEEITTSGDKRVMPTAEELQEVKEIFDALIDEAAAAYDKERGPSEIAA